jgi:hypothetical protein
VPGQLGQIAGDRGWRRRQRDVAYVPNCRVPGQNTSFPPNPVGYVQAHPWTQPKWQRPPHPTERLSDETR